MGRVSILRNAMRAVLDQYKARGVEFDELERIFGVVDRRRLHQLLRNLQDSGEAHCKRQPGRRLGVWFPGTDPAARADARMHQAQSRQIRRAYLRDLAAPIVPCGAGLAGGRCASVWEYASHMKAAAGARA